MSAVLGIVSLKEEKNFHKYHRVLSLVEWCVLEAARILLQLLSACFLPAGPVIAAIDQTLERRRGREIAQRGIYTLFSPVTLLADRLHRKGKLPCGHGCLG